MKKPLKFLTILTLAFGVVSSSAYAETSTSAPDYDRIFANAGYPAEYYDQLDDFQKEMIVSGSGENLKFIARHDEEYAQDPITGELTLIEEQPIASKGIISPMSYIPVTKLKLAFDVFQGSSSDLRDVYESFTWVTPPGKGNWAGNWGISRDSIGIAVDTGWTIQSGTYSCGVQWNGYNPSNSSYYGWTDVTNDWCPNPSTRTPSEINLYGASWSFSSSPQAGNYNNLDLWKGTVRLTMKKTSSTAAGRVVGRYAQSDPNILGQFGVTVGWGPASITYTPTSGGVNTHDIDLSWSTLPGHNEG